MTSADIVNAVKDIRAEPSLSAAVALAIAHLVQPGAAGTEQTAPAEPPANNDEDESFKDWTPKFTVWLVRDGESWPMPIDTVWLNEADAQKRAELRGGKWHAMKYSHLQGPREAADGRSSTPTPQPRSGDTR